MENEEFHCTVHLRINIDIQTSTIKLCNLRDTEFTISNISNNSKVFFPGKESCDYSVLSNFLNICDENLKFKLINKRMKFENREEDSRNYRTWVWPTELGSFGVIFLGITMALFLSLKEMK